MNENYYAKKIADEIGALGIVPGNIVMVHSSFKSLGYIEGGIEILIQGLLLAITPEGTLMMPGLSGRLDPPDFFDVNKTPVNVGAVPEYFRKREGTIRSINPSHSACAVGKHSEEMLANHYLDNIPCGTNSPFRKLADSENGKIIMLGCSLNANTTMHALDSYYGDPPYPYLNEERTYTIKDTEGKTCRKKHKPFGRGACVQKYERVTELESAGLFLRTGRVLEAKTHVMDAVKLRDAVLKKLKETPTFFIS